MLADEMGLGKTLQTVGFIDALKTRRHCTKPVLVVAPLSTIPHWQREFESWSDLNTIVYYGNAHDRATIREMEFGYPKDRPVTDAAAKKLKNYHKNGSYRTTVDLDFDVPVPVKFDYVSVSRKVSF